MDMLKKCFNPKVLLSLAIIGVGVAVFAPELFLSVLPLLLIAACPLSMVVMMIMMNKHTSRNKDR